MSRKQGVGEIATAIGLAGREAIPPGLAERRFEIETFEAQGFEPVHIGERILRVEAAVPALLSRLL